MPGDDMTSRAVSRHARTTRRNHDERGNALIMVLVLITIVSVTCGAILNSEWTNSAVQTASTTNRKSDMKADDAIDAVIQRLRDDNTGYDGRNISSSDTHFCSGNPTPAYNTMTVNGVQVVCQPQSGSGGGPASQADPYPYALETLGGSATGVNTTATPDPANPFCDDRNAGSTCETGLQVGRGTSTGSYGLYVASNGAPAGTPLIRTNSSITVNQFNIAGGDVRLLQVQGSIWGRRACGPINTSPPEVQTNYNITTNAYDSWSLDPYAYTKDSQYYKCWINNVCALPGTNNSPPSGSCFLSAPSSTDPQLIQDPISDFHHNLWSDIASANPSVCVNNLADEHPIATQPNCGLVTTVNGVNPPVNLPRNPAQVGSCAAGEVDFSPGYYDSANALNQYIGPGNCHNVLFWFKPGIYYFDFTNADGGGYVWGGSGKPTDPGGSNPEQVWLAAGQPSSSWTPCAPDCSNANQPAKLMNPQYLDTNPNTGTWTPADMRGMMSLTDTDYESATLTDNNMTPSVTLGKFATPLSLITNGCTTCYVVHNIQPELLLSFDIQQQNNANGSDSWQKRKLDIWTGSGHCVLTVPESSFPPTAPLHIPLNNGCNSSLKGWSGTPANQISLSTATPSGSWPAIGGWQPIDVDRLQIQLIVQKNTSTASTTRWLKVYGAQVSVSWTGPPSPPFPGGCDPLQSGVQWIFGGRSQLDFDDGNLTAPGDNQGFYMELCGSKTANSAFGPAVVGLVDHAGLATKPDGSYMSNMEASCCGSVAQPWSTDAYPAQDPLPATNPPNPTISAVTFTPSTTTTDSSPWSLTDGGPNSAVPYSATNPANYRNDPVNRIYDILSTAGDGKMLTNKGRWTDNSAVSVSYNLPSNLVPTDAIIERVEVDVTHAEQGAKAIQVKSARRPGTAASAARGTPTARKAARGRVTPRCRTTPTTKRFSAYRRAAR